MDIQLFTKMLRDDHFTDYHKMSYKYTDDFPTFLQALEALYYKPLPLSDFEGKQIVYIANHAAIHQNTVKLLLQAQNHRYGLKAAEEEIMATSAIESIDFKRDSVRRILKGMAPKDEQENRILGMKNGLEFIADTENKMTEENIYRLYKMAIVDFLDHEEQLAEGCLYRHDTVYIVSDRIEHAGLDYKKIPDFMQSLIAFIHTDDDMNDLIKAAVIHFYIAYIHPYFDGNGRMARLLHLWFLIQKGYQSALFIPFSAQIEKSRKAYYDAFTAVEENKKYSGRIDVTPFLSYFINNVYNHIKEDAVSVDTLTSYENAVKSGKVTEKEIRLWQFVLSCYGTEEFSTKQLEKDFSDAAYATIRSFVMKFEAFGLLSSVRYGTRVKYFVS